MVTDTTPTEIGLAVIGYVRKLRGMQSAVKTTSEETVKVRIEQMLHEMMQPVGVKLLVCGLVCPGGLEAPCGEHGDCDDGRTGTGTCKCHRGFEGTGCEMCEKSHFGPNCTGNTFSPVLKP